MAGPSARCINSRVTKAVVGTALLGVRQHGVGLGGVLEALFCLRVVWVPVGMIAHGDRPVRLFERNIIRIPGDTQNLVVVALGQ